VSTIPTAIIGIIDADLVEQASKILLIPGICLILTSILLVVADCCKGGEKLPKQVTYSNAFIIGIAQGVATLPGLSRSGTTIAACLLSGFNKKFAVKYSFIMSIPAVLGSLVFELSDLADVTFTSNEILYYLIGMVVAAVVGYICIKAMLYVVRQKKFTWFAIYCFLVGVISVAVYFYRV
jgi:undecaprenyl-diphosphatase